MTTYDVSTAYDSTGTYDGDVTYDSPIAYDSGTAYDGGGTTPTSSGSATGSTSWAGAASGVRPRSGIASGSTSWAGSAVGDAPAMNTATGATSWAGTATGRSAKAGSATGTTAWSGVASGSNGEGDNVNLASTAIHGYILSVTTGGGVVTRDVMVGGTIVGGVVQARLTPVSPPLGVLTEWPVKRQAHLMPALSEAVPTMTGVYGYTGDDPATYNVDESDAGRLHVFVNGQDVTYFRGVPTQIDEWSHAAPFCPQAATFTLPQAKPWETPGVGGLALFQPDAPVEIAFVRPDAPMLRLWEGHIASETSNVSPGRSAVTFNCEGLFQQAAHWMWDPPVLMRRRDVGFVIADALNAVPHRRWAYIGRFRTGQYTTNAGQQGQSVLAYVADLMASTFRDDDGRQLHLRRIGPNNYRIQWKPTIDETTGYTYTKGAPGVELSFTRPHSSRRDAVFVRGFGEDGGFWCNRQFPGLAASTPPVYPMAGFADMPVGTTDADTVGGKGVSTIQARLKFIGYPVTVDGVINAADVQWIRRIQRERGLLTNGVLGPQTWAGAWESTSVEAATVTYRLPMASVTGARPFLYDGTGAKVRKNPADDPRLIIHAMPEVDAGQGVNKSNGFALADFLLERERDPGEVGTLTVSTSPHEAHYHQMMIANSANVQVLGHNGGVVIQASEVRHTPTSTTITGDTRMRDGLLVDAVLDMDRDRRRQVNARRGITDRSSLNASQLVQFESESPAGKFPKTAINGNAGLGTVRCIFISQVGVAKFMMATSPAAETIIAVFGKPVTPNQVEAYVPNALGDDSGWYDNKRALEQLGLIEVFGSVDSPGGYFPRQKSDGGVLTGVTADEQGLTIRSQMGGFYWVYVLTGRSTYIQGEWEPAVPTT